MIYMHIKTHIYKAVKSDKNDMFHVTYKNRDKDNEVGIWNHLKLSINPSVRLCR